MVAQLRVDKFQILLERKIGNGEGSSYIEVHAKAANHSLGILSLLPVDVLIFGSYMKNSPTQ
jgi:hypothetical protein